MKQPIRVLALFASLAGLYAILLSQSTRPGEDSYVRGQSLANQYECVRAIEEFDRAINASPNDPRYYTSRANCRVRELANTSVDEPAAARASRVNAALEDLAEAIKADPNYAEAYFERATIRSPLARVGEARMESVVQDLDRAIDLEPENTKFLAGRAHFLLFDAKDERRGLVDMELLIKLEPNNSDHLFDRALYFAKTARLDLAIEDLSAAVKLDPDDFFIRGSRANAYFETKNYAAALANINHLLKDPNVTSISLLQLRAKVYRAMGKRKLAEADERRAKKEQIEWDRDLEKLAKP